MVWKYVAKLLARPWATNARSLELAERTNTKIDCPGACFAVSGLVEGKVEDLLSDGSMINVDIASLWKKWTTVSKCSHLMDTLGPVILKSMTWGC